MASTESIERLRAFPGTNDFFIGIDSDGCAFDTMEIKQKECFIPNTIFHYALQAVSKYVRETEAWVNLYSEWRGINRFPALVKVFDLLARRPECIARGYQVPEIASLRRWMEEESQLGNPALAAKVEAGGDPVLAKALEWSTAVNETVARMVHGVPPYPHVRESIEKVTGRADVMVVSATPNEALEREWAEHDLDKYAAMICGQEMGKKAEHLKYGAVGKYEQHRMLMIGDAPGDLKAARANDILFFPINPGDEESSWKLFHDEAAERFFAGDYGGDYEQRLIDDFMAHLPSEPPWPTV